MAREGKKRLSIDIPEKTHKKVEEYAEMAGQTMTVYVTRALWEKIKREHGEKELIKIIK